MGEKSRINYKTLPLIYSCSGVSNVAQLANAVAVSLDREGTVEMSCIAGVGGDVNSLVRTAKSGREIITLDGCPLECVKKSLARHGVIPDRHFMLGDYGFRKHRHEDFEQTDVFDVKELIYRHLNRREKPQLETAIEE